jgi:hypothetical protein
MLQTENQFTGSVPGANQDLDDILNAPPHNSLWRGKDPEKMSDQEFTHLEGFFLGMGDIEKFQLVRATYTGTASKVERRS